MNTKQTLRKGFTIIEVVLVLAIAGLIFLMVFVALPALQAGQRDTARKNDVGTVASAVSNYTGNSRGTFPTTAQLTSTASPGTPAGYTKAVSNNTTKITVQAAGTGSAAAQQGQIIVTQGTTCNAAGAATGSGSTATATETLNSGTSRQFTVVTFIEAGGGTSFCQDS